MNDEEIEVQIGLICEKLKQPQKIAHQALSSLLELLTQQQLSQPLIKHLTSHCSLTLIEKLADSKDRLLARDILVSLYNLNSSTAYLDRLIREKAFANKGPKVRELIVAWLSICSQNPKFLLKNYLPPLIKLLEDNSEVVRKASKDALANIYQSATNKQVRIDIKKGLANTRQSIVDDMNLDDGDSFSSASSETRIDNPIYSARRMTSTSSLPSLPSSASLTNTPNKDHQTPKKPASVVLENGSGTSPKRAGNGSAAGEPSPLNVSSPKELTSALSEIAITLSGKETEENWQSRDKALQLLRGYARGNGRDMSCIIALLKPVTDLIVVSVQSLRTSLVITACSTITDLSDNLTTKFDSFVDTFITTLIKVTGQTNNLTRHASIKSLNALIKNSTFNLKHLTHFYTALNDNGKTVRNAGMVCVLVYVEKCRDDAEYKGSLERDGGVGLLDKCCRMGTGDRDAGVRSLAQDVFVVFEEVWADKALTLFEAFPNPIKKSIITRKKSKNKPLLKTASSMANLKSVSSSIKLSRKISAPVCTPSETTSPVSASRKRTSTSSSSVTSTVSIIEDPEDTHPLLSQLVSDWTKIRILAINELFNLTIPPSETLSKKFSIIMQNLYNSTTLDTELLNTLLDPTIITKLLDSSYISLESITISIISMKMSGLNVPDSALEYIRSQHSTTTYLNTLITALTSPLRVAGEEGMQGKMMRERRWNEYVLSLLVQGMPREVVNGVNLRGLIGHAIRLSEMGSENAYGVIERVWEWDQGLVRRVLGTIVDDGVRGNVFGRLGVVEEEEEEEKEEQGQAESLGRIDVGEKVEREVLDETLPDGFADISAQGTSFIFSSKITCQEDIREEEEEDPFENGDNNVLGYDSGNYQLDEKDVEKVVKRGGGGLVGSFEPTTPNHINTDNATTSYYPNTNRLDGLEDYIKPPKPPVGIVQGLTRIILENNSTVRLLDKTNTTTVATLQKSDYPSSMPTLLSNLADPLTIRQLIHISRETRNDAEFWNAWFTESVQAVESLLRQGQEGQEYALMYLAELLENQTEFFDGDRLVNGVFEVLVDGRSDGGNEISGASEKALEIMLKKLPRTTLLSSILSYLEHEATSNRHHANANDDMDIQSLASGFQALINGGRKNISGRPASYQPCPMRSALESLGVVLKRFEASEVLRNSGLVDRVFKVLYETINSPILDIRRGSVMGFVSVCQLVGDDRVFWELVGGKLKFSQEKLVAVYIERAKSATTTTTTNNGSNNGFNTPGTAKKPRGLRTSLG